MVVATFAEFEGPLPFLEDLFSDVWSKPQDGTPCCCCLWTSETCCCCRTRRAFLRPFRWVHRVQETPLPFDDKTSERSRARQRSVAATNLKLFYPPGSLPDWARSRIVERMAIQGFCEVPLPVEKFGRSPDRMVFERVGEALSLGKQEE